MPRLLFLSENNQLAEKIKADLERNGCLVWVASNCHLEVENILQLTPNLVLFDLSDWDEDKKDIYKMVSAQKGLERLNMAIVVLLNEGGLDFFSATLEFDDFLLTPYRLPELKTRLKRSLAKKNDDFDQNNIQIGSLTISPNCYEVKFGGASLDLTYKEYELLKYLATNRGRAFTRDDLLNAIWDYDYYGGTRTVDVHIRRIRAKLGDTHEDYIKTIRGVGYMFRE